TTGQSMLDTAENTAADAGFTRQQLDDLTFLRYEQYRSALADDRAVQRRYMVPVRVPGRKGDTWVEEDHGIFPITQEGLERLKPVKDGGVVSYGGQTHPADGGAGFVVTTAERARELSSSYGRDGAIAQLLSTGF